MPDVITSAPRTRKASKPFDGADLRVKPQLKPRRTATKATSVESPVEKLKKSNPTQKSSKKKTTVTLKAAKKISKGLS